MRHQAPSPRAQPIVDARDALPIIERGCQMTFLDRINEDLKAAMKSKDPDRLSTLRMVKTALKNREIDKMASLTDEESLKVLQSLVKQRRDSIEQFEQAGRLELA